MRTSFKLLNIAVNGRVYTVWMSKGMEVKVSSFDLVCILGYNVIGVIYIYISMKQSLIWT